MSVGNFYLLLYGQLLQAYKAYQSQVTKVFWFALGVGLGNETWGMN